MFINILIIALVFGYSGWMIYRHVQKGKQGACAGCDKSKTCAGASSDSPFSCSVGPADTKHSAKA
ncbi:FeoB-associated Cys-rich membrane protein [Paenibacillus sp. sgz5001063]|uniref:FeoB-associated Cys-rich membrane protein n=1 Tax=Paenibacillus sp. sgz5001063 TaxID=3242474 RepID=UPI0036D306A0